MTNYIWFRNDLRLDHNMALSEAISKSNSLEAIYILPKDNHFFIGEAAQWYLHHSLLSLEARLFKLGITLNFFIGDASDVFSNLLKNKKDSRKIFCNQSCNPIQLEIDKKVGLLLPKKNFKYIGKDTVFNPNTIKTNSNGFYKVFTPFSKKFKQKLSDKKFLFENLPNFKHLHPTKKTTHLSDLQLIKKKGWTKKFENFWSPGEINAHNLLNNFISEKFDSYPEKRDNLSEENSSKLSASINFGEVSIDYIFFKIVEIFEKSKLNCDITQHDFFNQLVWREFAKYSLFHNQDSYFKSIYDYCDSDILWNGDDILLELWQNSKTGINVIDASMEQLWQEGWMPNRARMITASFLTKNLGIHWVKGAKWFWDTLIDADLALNTMGWQWIAGTAPYSAQFSRIFNPCRQAEKHDLNGNYIGKYIKYKDNIKPIVSVSDSTIQAKKRYKKLREVNT